MEDGDGAGLNLEVEQGAVGQQGWGRTQWTGLESALLCWESSVGLGSWASWGYHQPAPHCTLWHPLEHSWAVFGREMQDWHWGGGCAAGGGSAEMQPQCPPQGVMCPQTVVGTPPCLQHTGICGEGGQIPAGNVPTCPRAPVWFMHTLSTAPCLFAGASLVIPCSLLNPLTVLSAGALCLCVHIAGLDLLWDSRGGGTLRFPRWCWCESCGTQLLCQSSWVSLEVPFLHLCF